MFQSINIHFRHCRLPSQYAHLHNVELFPLVLYFKFFFKKNVKKAQVRADLNKEKREPLQILFLTSRMRGPMLGSSDLYGFPVILAVMKSSFEAAFSMCM